MDDQRIAYLFETVRAGSIRAAAERLGVNASTISRQIALLEKDLGTPLLERLSRGIRPTEAGRLLVDYWTRQQVARADVEAQIRELRSSTRGTVRLATGEGFIGDLLAGPLQDFCRIHPGLTLSIEVMTTAGIVRAITEDEAEIGLVFNPPFDERLNSTARIGGSICLLAPRNHPLTSPETDPSLLDLVGQRVAALTPVFGVQQTIDAAMRRAGLSIDPVLRTNSFALLRRYVATGLAVALLPAFVAVPEIEEGSIVVRPIADATLETAEIHIVTRHGRRLPAAAMKFLSHLRSRLRAFGAPLAGVAHPRS